MDQGRAGQACPGPLTAWLFGLCFILGGETSPNASSETVLSPGLLRKSTSSPAFMSGISKENEVITNLFPTTHHLQCSPSSVLRACVCVQKSLCCVQNYSLSHSGKAIYNGYEWFLSLGPRVREAGKSRSRSSWLSICNRLGVYHCTHQKSNSTAARSPTKTTSKARGVNVCSGQNKRTRQTEQEQPMERCFTRQTATLHLLSILLLQLPPK